MDKIHGGHCVLLCSLMKTRKNDQNSSCCVLNSVVWRIYMSIIWNLCENHLEINGYSTYWSDAKNCISIAIGIAIGDFIDCM